MSKLHHIELYVSDLKRSCSFWGWLLSELGYHKHEEWSTGQSWKCNDMYFVLTQVLEKYAEPSYHRCRVGLNHIAFYANSKRCVDIIREEMISKGITLLYDEKYPFAGGRNHYAIYFEDPDRIKVELVAPLPE
jgi:catechol 2,3-dioxygenase-like lactoylglutathione lyase family enzyme